MWTYNKARNCPVVRPAKPPCHLNTLSTSVNPVRTSHQTSVAVRNRNRFMTPKHTKIQISLYLQCLQCFLILVYMCNILMVRTLRAVECGVAEKQFSSTKSPVTSILFTKYLKVCHASLLQIIPLTLKHSVPVHNLIGQQSFHER